MEQHQKLKNKNKQSGKGVNTSRSPTAAGGGNSTNILGAIQNARSSLKKATRRRSHGQSTPKENDDA
jgi:hypothetical protein